MQKPQCEQIFFDVPPTSDIALAGPRSLHNGHCGQADIPIRERAEVKPDVCRYRLRGTAARTSSNGDGELPSVSQEAVDDFSVDLARAQATGAIVMLLGHTVRVVQHCAGEVGGVSSVRCRGRGCGSSKEVGRDIHTKSREGNPRDQCSHILCCHGPPCRGGDPQRACRGHGPDQIRTTLL